MDNAIHGLPDDLESGIERAVRILFNAGIKTTESCEGGSGHPWPEPIIFFDGEVEEGFKALAIAIESGLPVWELRRVWNIIDGYPEGPTWEMTFLNMPIECPDHGLQNVLEGICYECLLESYRGTRR